MKVNGVRHDDRRPTLILDQNGESLHLQQS